MTEYKEGSHEEFINYLFSNSPKEKGIIVLESPLEDVSNQEHPSARIITERIFNLKEDTQELNDRCSSS